MLCKAIDSALAQDYPEHLREIVVIDDGSTDDTRAVVGERYGDRVRYIHQPNGGINAACQFGFSQTRGDYVAQLDSDDWWYPGKLSATVPLLDEHPDVAAVIHDLDVFRPDKTGDTVWSGLRLTITEAPCDGLAEYLAGNPVPAYSSGAVWRKSALQKILPFPAGLETFNDTYCTRHILFFGRICALKTPLGGYFVHSSNYYGGGVEKRSPARLEHGLRQVQVMKEAFDARCREHGRRPSLRREMIQKLALGDVNVKRQLQKGRRAAAAWVLRNELEMPALARIQLLLNLYLPPRAAIFIKNRVIGRFVPMD
jgi:hypothetical protein